MITRVALVAAACGLAAVALWHQARPPGLQSESPAPAAQPALPAGNPHGRSGHARSKESDGDIVVYVAGAVRRPGLYHLHDGQRNAQAVALAGGLSAAADPGAINLAQRVADGDEIYVPVVGETARAHSAPRHGRRPSTKPPPQSVDVNESDAAKLAAVPGIGIAIARRIVELRQRLGNFGSLDELLDVAGMTQSRLERARPYLRAP
jgi:competence protein ComEA